MDEGEFIRVKRKDGIASFSALCDDPGPARLFVDSRRDGAAVAGGNGGDFKVIASGAPLNGPISGALLVNGDLVVGNTLDPSGTNLLIEISPTAGVVATKNVDTGAAGAIFGIVTVPTIVTTMGPYGMVNTQTNLIYFNDDNTNTVMLLAP